VWVQLPPGIRADQLQPLAIARGMAFLPAHRFFLDEAQAPGALRLAFSMYPPEVLDQATGRLGDAIVSYGTIPSSSSEASSSAGSR
jgi:DNA-binding transcriptional MocR family regulator